VTVLADQKDLKAPAVRGEPGPDLPGPLTVVGCLRQDDRPLGRALGGRFIDPPLRFGSGVPGGGNDDQHAVLPVEFIERRSIAPVGHRDHPQ